MKHDRVILNMLKQDDDKSSCF